MNEMRVNDEQNVCGMTQKRLVNTGDISHEIVY